MRFLVSSTALRITSASMSCEQGAIDVGGNLAFAFADEFGGELLLDGAERVAALMLDGDPSDYAEKPLCDCRVCGDGAKP